MTMNHKLNLKDGKGPVAVTGPTVTVSSSVEQRKIESLLDLVADTVDPKSWEKGGGQAVIKYHSPALALVVRQTAENQEQIAELLKEMRRLQKLEVAVEIRFITCSDAMLEGLRHKGDLAKSDERDCDAPFLGRNLAVLDDLRVYKLMETIQADRKSSVMQVPRMTIGNGQKSQASFLNQEFFVLGMEVERRPGQVVFCPKNQPLSTGVEVTAQPAIAADKRSVFLTLQVDWTEREDGDIPLVPITALVQKVLEGGVAKAPIPFTQMVQQPRHQKVLLQRTMKIPDGRSVMIGGWKTGHSIEEFDGPPLLAYVPYVSDYFRTWRTETENRMLLVTTRILTHEEKAIHKTAKR